MRFRISPAAASLRDTDFNCGCLPDCAYLQDLRPGTIKHEAFSTETTGKQPQFAGTSGAVKLPPATINGTIDAVNQDH
jgi:hypothetical protein